MGDFSVTYGSYVIGGASTDNAPLGGYVERDDYATYELEFSFLMWGEGSTEALRITDFAANKATMEAALTLPNQALTVTYSPTNTVRLRPASQEARIMGAELSREPDDRYDNPWQARYGVRFFCQVPADAAGRNGRISSELSVSYTAARRRAVTISGVWGFTATVEGITNYIAQIATYAATVLTALGGTYKKIGDGPLVAPIEGADSGHVDFSVQYEEIIYQTSTSNVLNESVIFTRGRSELSSGATRNTGRVEYSASFDFENVTSADVLWDLWDDTIRAVILTKAAAVLDADTAIVVGEIANPVITDNTLSVTLDLLLVASAYTYRKRAEVTSFIDASQRKTITLTGAYHMADGGDAAEAKYTADIGTFATAVLPSGPTWELTNEGPLTRDDDDQELRFTRIYREQLWTGGSANGINESLTVRRIGTYSHGKTGKIAAIRAVVGYTVAVDKGQDAKAIWDATLRGAVLSKVSSMYGGSTIVEFEDLGISATGSTMNVSMQVFLKGLGDTIISYDETSTIQCNYRPTIREKLDGKPNTVHFWSNGPMIVADITVVSETIGASTTALKLEGRRPPRPPREFTSGTGGWLPLTGFVQIGETEKGRAPGGAGATMSTVLKASRRTFRWIDPSSKRVTPSRIGAYTYPPLQGVTGQVNIP